MINRIRKKFKLESNNIKVRFLRKFYLNKIKSFDRVVLFLVPNDDQINGGVLSITSIHKEFTAQKKLHNCEVLTCTNFYNSEEYFLKFSKFKNKMMVFDINSILKKLKTTTFLQLHIPELYLESFIHSYQNNWTSADQLIFQNIKSLQINILNQNDLLMPNQLIIQKYKDVFNCEITITVAHKRYANIDKKNQYNVPLHYLSAWINPVPYDFKLYDNKKNIIVFSPDELSRLNIEYHLSKTDLITRFKENLPNFEIVVVKNMTYENYKKLVANCKFMITFGEGLDGYLVETILSGGISFAIYNAVFFTEGYEQLPTIYKTVDDLFNNIEKDIRFYDNKIEFDTYNNKMKEVCEIEYSYEKYQKRVLNFLNKNYDFK